ncbi:hypothetical protein CBW16_10120 [Flavobacteriaceae bacterium JJC]|nr:hypothetical protein CBW16_10120 [Flavobacteriaceae bacterium JJC]
MINFLPFSPSFGFSDLYNKFSGDFPASEIKTYPFANLRLFFETKNNLPAYLKLDETKIGDFENFKEIFLRGDNFYLIAYKYFEPNQLYSFDHKLKGILILRPTGAGKNLKIISYFDAVYSALQKEFEYGQSLLRQEYVLIERRFQYINRLTEFLLSDYDDLQTAIRKNQNIFAKYGVIISEVYINVFRNFYSNFVDYLSDENFTAIKNLVYPSKKEVQSFRFAVRINFKHVNSIEAKELVVLSFYNGLRDMGFIAESTVFEQLYDLFDNRRREKEKIIWIKDATSLHSFYKLLEDEKIIEDSENKHWKILADYFKIGETDIEAAELKKLKGTTSAKVKDNLNAVIKEFNLNIHT